jgi:hypothetical protein
VELRPHLSQRPVHLGCQHEHGQPGLQREPAADESQPDRDGDERHGQRREQLEHHPGQERDPQRPHRRPPVGIAERPHPRRRPSLAPEGTQRRQAREEVEDLGAEPRHRAQPPLRPALGHPPDEDHEDRDQREGADDDRGRDPVHPEDDEDRRGRHGGRQHQLRQVADEVRLQRVQPAGGQRHDLGAASGGQPARAEGDGVRDDPRAQLADRAGGGPVGEPLLQGHDRRARDDDRHQPADRRS